MPSLQPQDSAHGGQLAVQASRPWPDSDPFERRRIDCDASRKGARFYPDDQTNKAILRHIWENDIEEVELRAGKLYYKSAKERTS